MNYSTDDSSSDSEAIRVALKETDQSAIEFYFLKTGKSKGEGVLITHGDTFKFTKNNANRNGTLHYYACSMKLTHKCQARAIVRRSVIVGEKEEEGFISELIEIATPEVSGILYYTVLLHLLIENSSFCVTGDCKLLVVIIQ